MLDTLIPFHEQAEEVGNFLREDRAQDFELRREENEVDGPSENID